MSAGGSDMPAGGCTTAGEVWPGQKEGKEMQRALAPLSVGGAAPDTTSAAGVGKGKGTEPYLGLAGLHFSPPGGGLWGLQDKEEAGH